MKSIYFALLVVLAWSSKLPAQRLFRGQDCDHPDGIPAGGAFDVWGRTIAAHIGKYIPGNPTFVVQNMTGGGSMIAANYVYGVAKPDGLTLGIVSPGIYISSFRDIQRFGLNGSNTVGWALPKKPTASSIFVRILLIKL